MMIEASLDKDLNFLGKLIVHRLFETQMAKANQRPYSVVLDRSCVFFVDVDYEITEANRARFSENAVIFRPEVC